MEKKTSEKSKSKICPCYLTPQQAESIGDDGLIPVRYWEATPETLSLPAHSDKYKLRQIPTTYSDGALLVGNSTFLNKYCQIKDIANGMEGGPTYVDTRDNQVVIHNGKKAGMALFEYTYYGGTGELIEFSVSTKYSQSIETVKTTAVNPDTKEIETDIAQCIPANLDPCNPDAWVRNGSRDLINQADNTRMVKPGFLAPRVTICRQDLYHVKSHKEQTPYASIEDAKAKIEANPSLNEAEVKKFNKQLEDEWKKYKDALKEYEKQISNGNTDVSYPLPPYEVSYFTIHRKVKVYVDPMDYSTLPRDAYAGNKVYWESGFIALEKNPDMTIVYPTNKADYSAGNNYGTPGDKVLVEMWLDIQIPGVRVVADPLFLTLGDSMANELVESVESQIKAKAKFVGNPFMTSSQSIRINNVGGKYSGEWYAKEVTHEFDSNGYFTIVEYEKKSRSSIVNRVRTNINTQEVFQKAHEVAEESYKTQSWKKASQMISTVKKRQDAFSGEEVLLPEQVRDVPSTTYGVVDKDGNLNIYQSHKDFETGRRLK